METWRSSFCEIIITRLTRPDWETYGGIEIEEWLDLIAADSELVPVDEIVGHNPATGTTIKTHPVGVAHLEHTEVSDSYLSLFRHLNGEIHAKLTSLKEQQKALEIADKLNANLKIFRI